MTTSTVHSPLKWIGGKSASASRIVAAFPAPERYTRYVETCGGAAHVLFARPLAWSHREVYNDLDNNLVTFWQQVQLQAVLMAEYLEELLYSRQIYYEFYRSLFDGTQLSDFERACRWFYCLRSTGTGWLRKSPVGWDYRESNRRAYYSILDTFESIQQRLRTVVIDNRDVLATIRRYDAPDTLIYLDPPYFGVEGYYEPSKKGFPHEEMALLLNTIRGYAAVSYYPHPAIDAWYPPEKWHRMTWQQAKSSQIQLPDRGDVATELLLTNYEAPTKVINLWEQNEIDA